MPTRQLSLHHFFIHRHHPQPRTRRRQRRTTRGRPGDTEGGTRWAYKVRPLFLFFIFYFTYFNSTPSSPNMFPSTENMPTCHSCRPQLTRDVPHLPNTKNTPPSQHVPTSRTPERALVGTFWCSLLPSLVSNTRKCPHVTHLSPPHLEHQNVPAWARSGAHAPPLSLSLISNTRTSPCVARSGARAPPLFLSLISSIRTSPHRLILMFGHPSPSQPPE